jgi:NADH:ubiquinone oxidoreductase subunit F (NADH-binding)/NADH:ubiquinone oxidoreductase subunit E
LKKTTQKDEATILDKIAKAGGLTPGVADEVKEATGVPAADVFGAGSFYHLLARPDKKVRICQGLSCWLAGAPERLSQAEKAGLPAEGCSCLAACDQPVAVLRERTVLPSINKSDIENTNGNWETLTSSLTDESTPWAGNVGPKDTPDEQLSINLTSRTRNVGGAYARSLDMGVDKLVDEIEASGLQGRGGSGFPSSRKLQSVLSQTETTRYVVLNADEGEPGTFKDRDVLLHRSDLVIEGLAIIARAIGAKDIYCYIRGEFTHLQDALKKAISDFTSTVDTDIQFHIHEGHGAYICGEETALLEALEGRRGMPRARPPFPTEQGLWGKPTLMHNVETIACVPSIVMRGGEWFSSLGKTGSGTKLYSISGHVNAPGTYELPLGITLDELAEVAGGYQGQLKAFSPGGASSGFLPATERARPLDWSALREVDSGLGSAGVVVLNDTVSIAEAVRVTLKFFEDESCGQCAPCRIGTRVLREATDRFISSKQDSSLAHVEDVAWEMNEGSICGLGHAAWIPLASAMRWFPEEFGNAGGKS